MDAILRLPRRFSRRLVTDTSVRGSSCHSQRRNVHNFFSNRARVRGSLISWRSLRTQALHCHFSYDSGDTEKQVEVAPKLIGWSTRSV